MSDIQKTFGDLSMVLHQAEIVGDAEPVKLALHRHHVALHEATQPKWSARLESLDGKHIITADGVSAADALHELHCSLFDHTESSKINPAALTERETL